jgi:hypothetical protein
MKNKQDIEYIWRLWTILVHLETLVWEHYSDEFMELNKDEECRKYQNQNQDDDIPF